MLIWNFRKYILKKKPTAYYIIVFQKLNQKQGKTRLPGREKSNTIKNLKQPKYIKEQEAGTPLTWLWEITVHAGEEVLVPLFWGHTAMSKASPIPPNSLVPWDGCGKMTSGLSLDKPYEDGQTYSQQMANLFVKVIMTHIINKKYIKEYVKRMKIKSILINKDLHMRVKMVECFQNDKESQKGCTSYKSLSS